MKSTSLICLFRFLLFTAAFVSTASAQSNYATPYFFSTFAGTTGGPGETDATGTNARFSYPKGITVDSLGNVYVADTGNDTIRKVTPTGIVTTLAGTARTSGSVDGTGSTARFASPSGVAVDSTGNVYVADQDNHTIRKITPAGVVTTLAGLAGVKGSADGTGPDARFYAPESVAVDSNGNVYVADEANNTIRKITPAGAVTTLAGLAGVYDSTDGTGSEARFSAPEGVAIDNTGNVYVTEWFNHTIRKITPAGVVTTLAGSPGSVSNVDGPGPNARFAFPHGAAVDGAGNIYVADNGNDEIRKVSPAGAVTTLAGVAGVIGSADGSGSGARFNSPNGVAVDSIGNIYVADTNNCAIRMISPTGFVSTLAGAAGPYGSTDGLGSVARFFYPQGLAVDRAGNVFVADLYNHTVRKITPAAVVTTLAGSTDAIGSTDGIGSEAHIYSPQGVAVDTDGKVYVADGTGIRKITPEGAVSTLANTFLYFSYPSNDTSPYYPYGLAVDNVGNIYATYPSASVILKITPAGVITTLAGMAGIGGSVDGTGPAARFFGPNGVAVDRAGNLFVADTGNRTIRKITPAGAVTTLAGTAGIAGTSDGTGSTARFYSPTGVAVDNIGDVLVLDGDVIRKIAPSGLVTTLAGSYGMIGSADGIGSAARFYNPIGIAVDQSGIIYVANSYNHNIRKGQLAGPPIISTQPQSQSVADGTNVQFSVIASAVPAPTYQWYLGGTAFTAATTNTLSFTNARSTDAGDYTVVATNSLGNVTSNKATLTVSAAPSPTPAPAPSGSGGGGAINAWFVLMLLGLGMGRALGCFRVRSVL